MCVCVGDGGGVVGCCCVRGKMFSSTAGPYLPEANSNHPPSLYSGSQKTSLNIAKYPIEGKTDTVKKHSFRTIFATRQIQLFSKVEVNDAPSTLESALLLKFMIVYYLNPIRKLTL